MELASPFATILLIVLPPLASGPFLALLLFYFIRSPSRWSLPLFWLLMLLVDITAFFTIVRSLGDFFGPGDIACVLLPFTALATFVLSLARGRAFFSDPAEGDKRRSRYRLATAAIPLAQLLIMFLVMLLGPIFCELGWRACSGW